MIKKNIFLLIIFLSLNTICYSQTVFNKIYNYNYFARVNTVISTSDSGFLIAGNGGNSLIMTAIKVNNLGDTLWTFSSSMGIAGGHFITAAIESSDGNSVIGGITTNLVTSTAIMNFNAFLIKLNPNGDTIWVHLYGFPNTGERCHGLKETQDGGFILCGERINVNSSGNVTDTDVTLIKTDSNGILQWEKAYGGALDDWALSVALTSDGGYLMLGTTYNYGIGQYNMYLIKTDSVGNKLWQKTYGGNSKDYGVSLAIANDGSYLLAGGTYISTDSIAAYIVKTDTAGIAQWEKKYRGVSKRSEFAAVKQLTTGEIVVSGSMQGDTLNYNYYGQVKKLNYTDGSIIWQKQYDYFNTDTTQHYFYAMDICNDGGLVMAGMTLDIHHTVTAPRNAMWLVKTDCMGNDSVWDSVVCNLWLGIKEEPKEEISVYPNPATDNLIISHFENLKIEGVKIYNVLGEIIYQSLITNQQSKINVDVAAWLSGIYFIEIKTESKTINKKLIKQ